MADTLTPSERSERMSRIRSRDTKPELALRKAIHALGLRYRLGSRLFGKPDLVFPRHKAVVFVHGCFWHRHEGCKVATTPKSNTDFWTDKFSRNVERDARVTHELRAAGWRVFVAWECELTGKGRAVEHAEHLAISISQTHDRQLDGCLDSGMNTLDGGAGGSAGAKPGRKADARNR